MYDIHCHILFGIGHGARSIEESLEICRISAEQGMKIIIATPHYRAGELELSQTEILSQITLLNQELKNQDIELLVLPGMEVYLTPDLMELYEQSKIITLNHKNYMLIELPPLLYGNTIAFLEEVLFRLQLKGVRPVIAHPERCENVISDPNIVYDLIERGCKIQVNANSIERAYGREVKKTAYKLLKHKMVHIIASDNHPAYEGMSSMKKCYYTVSEKFGEDTAQNLFINNPYKVLNGEDLIIEEPEVIKNKKFWIV